MPDAHDIAAMLPPAPMAAPLLFVSPRILLAD
jgi:hypothetical protein